MGEWGLKESRGCRRHCRPACTEKLSSSLAVTVGPTTRHDDNDLTLNAGFMLHRYGDPAAAQARVPGTAAAAAAAAAEGGTGGEGVGGQAPLRTVDFGDTFLDAQHVVEAFPQFKVGLGPGLAWAGVGKSLPSTDDKRPKREWKACTGARFMAHVKGQAPHLRTDFIAPHCVCTRAQVSFVNKSGKAVPAPPFRITFPTQPLPEDASTSGADAAAAAAEAAAAGSFPAPADPANPAAGELVVEAYVPPDPGPYPQDQPRRNAVRFTPVQVRAPPLCWHGVSLAAAQLWSASGGLPQREQVLVVPRPGPRQHTLAQCTCQRMHL